jgi:hypothetical protein
MRRLPVTRKRKPVKVMRMAAALPVSRRMRAAVGFDAVMPVSPADLGYLPPYIGGGKFRSSRW